MVGTHSGLGGRGGGVCLVVLGGGDLGRQAPLWSIQPGWSSNRNGRMGGGGMGVGADSGWQCGGSQKSAAEMGVHTEL